MRLTAILLLVSCIHVSAKSWSQNVNFSGESVSLEKVFLHVKKQTGLLFIYDPELVKQAKTVSVNAVNMPLEKFLKLLLKDQPLDFTIRKSTISIRLKPLAPAPLMIDSAVYAFRIVALSGKVTGENNEPLAGVSVRVSGTNQGTTTSNNGVFTLSNIDEKAILVISFVGYRSVFTNLSNFPNGVNKTVQDVKGTWKRSGELQLDIALRLVVDTMERVEISVNTGYQRIKPEQSTGSVSKISAKEYESRVSTDFLSGLVNKLPGLMINNDVRFNATTGDGATSNSLFNIRGISTISGNQNPLIVLDGYPTDLSIDMINPNEIETVTILKDAAAATVYGVRASNGVIVVERKQAVAGKSRVNFRSTLGITPKEDYTRYRWDDSLSAINVAYQREINKNLTDAGWANMFNNQGIAKMPVYYTIAQLAANVITTEQAEEQFAAMGSYNNAADYGRLFLRNAITQNYNLNVSGGSKGALYYISAGYTGNRSSMVNNKNGMFQLNGRTTLDITKRLGLELSIDLTDTKVSGTPVTDINSTEPYERFEDASGKPLATYAHSKVNPYYNQFLMSKGFIDFQHYPLLEVNELSNQRRAVTNRVTANFKYRIAQGISAQFGGVYETGRTEDRNYASEKSSVARQLVNSYTLINALGVPQHNIPQGGNLRLMNANLNSYTVRGQLNYDKRFSKHHTINGIVGGEIKEAIEQASSSAYFGYDNQTLLQRPINYDLIATDFTNPFLYVPKFDYLSYFTDQYVNNRYLSGYTNIAYTYRGKYSLSGSMRVDQSNLFGTNPKYKYKPLWSLGAAWNIHKEPFMEQFSWLTNLKLRVADGLNGNVAKNSLPRVIAMSSLNTYMQPISPSLRRSSLANSSLRWEQTRNQNIGLDIAIHNRISASIDVYRKKSTDLLAMAEIDATMGGSYTSINTASIMNSGLEIDLKADWMRERNLSWFTGFIFARNYGKTLKVYQILSSMPSALNGKGYLEGAPVGALYAYRWGGLDDRGMATMVSEDGTVHKNNDADYYDVIGGKVGSVVRLMGASIPKYNAGLNNRIDIGNFWINVMVSYYGGFKVQAPGPNPTVKRPIEGSGAYWKQPGDELHTDIMSIAGYAFNYGREIYDYADIRTVNGDYLTLRDVTLSYNFANYAAIRNAGFSLFELKLQASNLYTRGLNKYNYSMATGNFAKPYITPTYSIALFTNF